MSADRHPQGLLDTNIIILREWIDPTELPDEMAISSVTLAELSAGPHLVRPASADPGYEEAAERARRIEVLQRVEAEFDPIPFGADAARAYGRIVAAVAAIGRSPRRRTADQQIAAVALVESLPLYTTNPDDFAGLADLITVVSVTRPSIPRNTV